MINQCQTGFRKGFLTIDNMFVLQCIFGILRNQKREYIVLALISRVHLIPLIDICYGQN